MTLAPGSSLFVCDLCLTVREGWLACIVVLFFYRAGGLVSIIVCVLYEYVKGMVSLIFFKFVCAHCCIRGLVSLHCLFSFCDWK